ncbi:MAG: hypothetical protein KDK76_07890 [Chlamydiia bacterium]|nr:hypothetical protein [Chlamydiia bacterium]
MKQTLQTAVAILGVALSDLVPQGFLLKGGARGETFYYDIVLGETLSEEMVPHLENRMKEIVKRNDSIKVHEMIPSNARELFRHHRRFYPTFFAEKSQEPLLQVVQIDPFVDLVEGNCLSHTGDLPSFKLTGIEERPELVYKKSPKKVYRVLGRIGEKRECDPLKLGEELGLFHAKIVRGKDYLEHVHLAWTGKGEALFFQIYEKWRYVHLKAGYELVIGGEEPPCAEFFSDKKKHYDRCLTKCLEKDLTKTLEHIQNIIASLIPEKVKQRSILNVRKNQGSCMIEHSVFPSVEQMIFDILEDSEKDLSQKKELLGTIADCDELG